MSLFQQLLGVDQPQQQMGGVFGQLAQAQPQMGLMPQSPMQTAKPKFWQSPEFASTLSRLGANLAAASTGRENFLDAASLAVGQTQKDVEAANAQAMQNQLLQAQIAKTQAEAQPSGPFQGTGFENQVAGTYYNAYLAQGMSPMEAQVKAAQAVFNREPTYIQGPEGPVPVSGRQLPSLGGVSQASPTQVVSQGSSQDFMSAPLGDPISQAAGSMGLLPPPSGNGKPDMALMQGGGRSGSTFSIDVPQMGGGKTQQAMREAAGKGEVEVQTEFGKQLADIEAKQLSSKRETASSLNDLAPDMERLTMAIQQYGDTGTFGNARLVVNKVAAQFGVADPERVAEGELVSKLVSKMAPKMRPVGGGSSSDRDVIMFVDSLPNLYTTPQGSAAAYQYFNKLKEYQNKIANEAENYAYTNRTMRGFNDYIEAKKKAGEITLWNDEERAVLNAAMKGIKLSDSGVPQVNSKAEFDKLKSGTEFLDPNGVKRRKP